jgi:hypothetical protein
MADELSNLRAEVAQLQAIIAQLRPLLRLRIAPESGGGNVVFSKDEVVLKLDGVTRLPAGAPQQVPSPTAPPPVTVSQQVTNIINSLGYQPNGIAPSSGAAGSLLGRVAALEAAISGASIEAVCNSDSTITVTLTWGA